MTQLTEEKDATGEEADDKVDVWAALIVILLATATVVWFLYRPS